MCVGVCVCVDVHVHTIDIDECSFGIHSCHQSAVCENNDGSYTCSCRNGFEDISNITITNKNTSSLLVQCSDIDECSVEVSPCDENATCHNNVGNFSCICHPGLTGDGQDCSEVDECAVGLHLCHGNAQCQNTNGSHECQCVDGFAGSGEQCDDLDECSLGTHTCQPQKQCRNLPGTFSCTCPQGYVAAGDNCTGKLNSIF